MYPKPSRVTRSQRGDEKAMLEYVKAERVRRYRTRCSVCHTPGESSSFDMSGRCDPCVP